MQKRILIIILTVAPVQNILIAQDTISKYINEIRKEYYSIQEELRESQVIKYNYKAQERFEKDIDFTGYIYDNLLVRLTAAINYPKYTEKRHYYFKNNALIFLFIETENDTSMKEERFYYHNNILIKSLYKLKNKEDNTPLSKIPNEIHPGATKYESQYKNRYQGDAWDHTNQFYTYPVFPEEIDNAGKVRLMKEEYNRILRNKPEYRSKEVFYNNYMYADSKYYTGYFNEQNQLVLLEFSLYDGGYETDYEYYFKDGQAFYVFRNNYWEPENEESQEFAFIDGRKVILFLMKKKPLDDETPFSEIESTEETEFYEDEYTSRPAREMNNYIKALHKEEENP